MKYRKALLNFVVEFLFCIVRAQGSQVVRRALDPSIDLNRTPSPELSSGVNEAQMPVSLSTVEDIAMTKKSEAVEALNPNARRKRRLYPTKHQKLRQAYNNRFEIHPYDEEKRKSIEKGWQKSVEERKSIHSRSKKRMWERIRAGKPTESDLRTKKRSQKATSAWRRAHPEKLRQYRLNRIERKKKETKPI